MKSRSVIGWLASICALFALLGLGGSEAGAADRIRLGVLEFQSKAEGVSDRQAQIITDIFTRTLASSKSIALYERVALQKIAEEHSLSASGLVDERTAIQIGKIAGLQYILLGSVTELSQKTSGGFVPIGRVKIGAGQHEAKTRLDVRVINVATSEIRLALSEEGFASNAAQGISVAGVTYAEAEFGGLEARAIADATSRLGHEIRETLGGEHTYIVSVSGNDYTIDAGSTLGVQEGFLYLVYADGKSITDMNNNVIGKERIPLAVLKVRETSSAHSVCTLAPPSTGKLIARGDKIRPITPQKAKGTKFASSRPAASSGTFEQIFGDAGSELWDEVSPVASSTPAVASPASVLTPAPSQPTQPSQPRERRTIEGFDPNQSTDPKVVQTYPLSSGEANILGIKHRNAATKYNSNRYKDAYAEYSALAESYDGDYLAAYWAGMSAQKLKLKDDAASWLEKAVAINPDYQPAVEARAKLK